MVDRHHPGLAPTALLKRLSGGVCLTTDQLAADLDLTKRQVSDAAANLLRRDYLERMAVGCYQLTPAGIKAAADSIVIKSGPKGPRNRVPEFRDTLQQRAWTAMRNQYAFSVPDIALHAAKPGDERAERTIGRYLHLLEAVAYVEVSPHRVPAAAPTSNGHKFYRVLQNTGPRAPAKLSKAIGIHDFNLKRDVLCCPL